MNERQIIASASRTAKRKLPALDADDLAQEGRIKAWLLSKGKQQSDPSGLRTALIRMYANMIRDTVRRARMHAEYASASVRRADQPDQEVELMELVESYRPRLTPRQFRVLVELVWPSQRTLRCARAAFFRKRKVARSGTWVVNEGITSEVLAESLRLPPMAVKRDAAAIRKLIASSEET